jgi:integrase
VTIRKEPSGRLRAILKSHSHYVAGRTFDTRREAQAWLTRELAALSGGVDPRAGRATVRSLFPVWLDQRKDAVSSKTYTADCAVIRLTPTSFAALSVGVVTDRDVSRALLALTRKGLAEASVRRYRDSLSSFFAWAVCERLIAANPVTPTRVPKSPEPRTEMFPFGEQELERVYRRASDRNHRLADILLVDGWTGLRWSELRAIRVGDFVEVPMPILVVQQAQPEGVRVKRTKSRRTRRVPVADRVLPIVRALAAAREPDDQLCVTSTGHQLHATAFKRTLDWAVVGEGRRIHDLRHTAACLWLARGVDPVTVQAWMGHASIATTTSICTISGPLPTGPGWTGSTAPGTPWARGRTRSPNDIDRIRPTCGRIP